MELRPDEIIRLARDIEDALTIPMGGNVSKSVITPDGARNLVKVIAEIVALQIERQK